MNKTTVEIYVDDLPTWKRWKKKTGLNSAELHRRIIKSAQDKLRYDEFVKRDLTTRDDFKKPLSHCRINKKKISIEN